MKECDIYSTSRFVKLCKKNIIEDWKVNVLRFAGIFGILAVLFLWNGYLCYRNSYIDEYFKQEDPCYNFIISMFMICLFVVGSVGASYMMSKMSKKTGSVNVLMNPASMFEKYLFRWIWAVVIFTGLYLVAFFAADYLRVFAYRLIYPEHAQIILPVNILQATEGMEYRSEFITMIVLCYFYVQSLFVLGSSIWPKRSALKTFAASLLVAIVYFYIGWLSSKFFLNSSKYYDNGSEVTSLYASIIFLAVLTLFNWVMGYFRFKESEIIQRM